MSFSHLCACASPSTCRHLAPASNGAKTIVREFPLKLASDDELPLPNDAAQNQIRAGVRNTTGRSCFLNALEKLLANIPQLHAYSRCI
jgi:hypothetical protein